jgi:hypothetical protein
MNQPNPMSIRIPQDVRDWLKARAHGNCRTVNGEILQTLKAAMGEDQKVQAFWNTTLPNGQTLRQADDATADHYIRMVHNGQALVVADEHGDQSVVELSEGAA